MTGFTKPRDLVLACLMCLGLAAIIAPRVGHSQPQISPSICIDPACNSVQINPHTPFQARVFVYISKDAGFGSDSFTVPPGKRLIIEHVSAQTSLRRGTFLSLSFETTTGGISAQHYLVPLLEGEAPTGISIHAASQPIRAYADGGTTVRADVQSAPGVVPFTFSGYLVDVP